ncbi:MAG: N-acetylmuramoyl-L-alanine amidase [Candidatus Amulumruptor caecigallinarius]|nr:N-acetylmuramoyl-L-alanine amidase [Candidatus Amulumruptor caecigallinarius]
MKRQTAIDTIMFHCTATPEGREVSVKELDAWHKARNFEPYVAPDGRKVYAGYHILVHLDGTYERIRPDSERGQHCPQQNMNNRAVSIVYAGGVARDGKTPKDTRTDAQKRTLLTLARTMKARYPNAHIIGHRDIAPKACPSFDAKKEYSNI